MLVLSLRFLSQVFSGVGMEWGLEEKSHALGLLDLIGHLGT